MMANTSVSLSPSDVEAYWRAGFLICQWPLFSAAKFDRLKSLATEYAEEVKAGRRDQTLNVPHFTDTRLFEFLMDDDVLDLIELFLGPNIAFLTSQFFCKPPRTGLSVPWHADSYYWTNFIDPVEVVSIFLPIDDMSTENGCLRVLPRSFSGSNFHCRRSKGGGDPFFPMAVPDDDIDQDEEVDVNLKAGEFVLFDGRLLHGSNANKSGRRRHCFTLRYAPTTCNFHPVALGPARRAARLVLGGLRELLFARPLCRHHVYLARGKDLAGNSYRGWPGQPG